MDTQTWLPGGPYYELSLLLDNATEKRVFFENIFTLFGQEKFRFRLQYPRELEARIIEYAAGSADEDNLIRTLDLPALVEIAGRRKCRLFIAELSEELVKMNLWFYGGEFDYAELQPGIRTADKPHFERFLHDLIAALNPILATIGYEEDCEVLFGLSEGFPSQGYTFEKLNLEKITNLAKGNSALEYCWINAARFDAPEAIELRLAQ